MLQAYFFIKIPKICIYWLKICKICIICIYLKNGQNMHLHMRICKCITIRSLIMSINTQGLSSSFSPDKFQWLVVSDQGTKQVFGQCLVVSALNCSLGIRDQCPNKKCQRTQHWLHCYIHKCFNGIYQEMTVFRLMFSSTPIRHGK